MGKKKRQIEELILRAESFCLLLQNMMQESVLESISLNTSVCSIDWALQSLQQNHLQPIIGTWRKLHVKWLIIYLPIIDISIGLFSPTFSRFTLKYYLSLSSYQEK